MGYTTDFSGSFVLDRQLTKKEKEYINTFSDTRRMKRDVKKLMEMYDGKYGYPFPELLSGKVLHNSAETIYGNEGEYFVSDDGNCGQTHDESILDYNAPPGQIGYDSTQDFTVRWEENTRKINEGICQPGLWCQWVVNSYDEHDELTWDGGEKFYNYVPWLKYLIEHFFSKWGVKLNGEVEWVGEDPDDRGKIVVKDNVVEVYEGRITYKKIK